MQHVAVATHPTSSFQVLRVEVPGEPLDEVIVAVVVGHGRLEQVEEEAVLDELLDVVVPDEVLDDLLGVVPAERLVGPCSCSMDLAEGEQNVSEHLALMKLKDD